MGQLRSLALTILAAVAGCSSSTTAVDAGIDAFAIDDAAANDTGGDVFTPMTDASAPRDARVDAATPTLTITNLTVYGDCMPIVAADPIHASWTATIDGAAGTSATFTSALLSIRPNAPGATITQNLTVDMPAITLTGGHGSATQLKTGADANPPAGCTGVCGGIAHLMVTFTIDGAPVFANAQANVSCAF